MMIITGQLSDVLKHLDPYLLFISFVLQAFVYTLACLLRTLHIPADHLLSRYQLLAFRPLPMVVLVHPTPPSCYELSLFPVAACLTHPGLAFVHLDTNSPQVAPLLSTSSSFSQCGFFSIPVLSEFFAVSAPVYSPSVVPQAFSAGCLCPCFRR